MTADDGSALAVHSWLPDGVTALGDPAESGERPRAVVQIAHGMAEHAGRYARFAAALVEAGFAVHADDHRGHGESAEHTGLGYLGDGVGWDAVVNDLHTLLAWEKETYPGVPVILLGHSWGSFLARDVAIRFGSELDGLIVMGTGGNPGVAGSAGKAIAESICRVKGEQHVSETLNQLSFGSFNKQFAPQRTEFDWLSRDHTEVEHYLADPRCGFTCSASFFREMVAGVTRVNARKNVALVPKNLPILLCSGAKDPVGDRGKGVRQVATQYRRAGITDVAMTLYAGARHEILNEVNRDQVTRDILAWIEAHLRA